MEKLNNEAILKHIQEAFPTDVLFHEEPYGLLTIEVSPSKGHEIIEWLKNHETLSVNYLTNIAGVHYPEDAGREFAVVYQLHSWKNQFRPEIHRKKIKRGCNHKKLEYSYNVVRNVWVRS